MAQRIDVSKQTKNPYMFSAYRSTDVGTADGGLYTVVYDTELFDISNNYNNATGVFTAPVTGYYQISSSAKIVGNTGTAWLWSASTELMVNGNAVDMSHLYVYDQGRFTFYIAKTSNLYLLQAGDTVSVRASGDTQNGTNFTVAGGRAVTSFSGFLTTPA